MAKYLDDSGLLYFWQKIKDVFASKTQAIKNITRSGTTFTATRCDDTTFTFTQQDTTYSDATTTTHGLMSTADKTKLNGIETGAEVNQDAFSTIAVSGQTNVTADSSEDTLTFVGAGGITITTTASSDTITFTGTTYSDATQSAHGLMSTTDKTKLDGIANGAQVNQNAFSNVAVSGQTTVAADSATDTVTFAGAGGIAITTNATNDTVTFTGTTYTTLTQSQITAGTDTTGRLITAKLLKDNVQSWINTAISGSAAFQGVITSNTEISGEDEYYTGWYWVVGAAGTYVGQTCEPGDMIFCIQDRGSSYSADDFNVVQTNISIAPITNAEIDTILAA